MLQNSFEHIDMWLAEVGKYTNENPLKLLVGSRIDLKEQRIVTTEMGRDLAQKIGVDFIETSSKEGPCCGAVACFLVFLFVPVCVRVCVSLHHGVMIAGPWLCCSALHHHVCIS